MKKDIVFTICETMLHNSPEASYKRLNPALRSTLQNCIEADLPFQPDTFQRIYSHLRGGWWFGDGAGSATGEHFYNVAVGCNHASAIKSFEQFAVRPGVLWEEDANIPQRLHVGAQFTWKGHSVTITSMRTDSLVACTYKDTRDCEHGIKVGDTIGYGENEHVITASKRAGNGHALRVIKSAPNFGERTIAKRFTITYQEISEFRRTEKARLKIFLKRIASCDPVKDVKQLTKDINAEHFRHFQLEEINLAFGKRRGAVADGQRVEQWRKGDDGAWLDINQIILRVTDEGVDCSNGNHVSLAAARRVLPILLDQRHVTASLDLSLDHHRVTHIGPSGVKVGCTLIPWNEVEGLRGKL